MVPERSRRVVASLSVNLISPQGAIGNFGEEELENIIGFCFFLNKKRLE